jgi:hypothetical protein
LYRPPPKRIGSKSDQLGLTGFEDVKAVITNRCVCRIWADSERWPNRGSGGTAGIHGPPGRLAVRPQQSFIEVIRNDDLSGYHELFSVTGFDGAPAIRLLYYGLSTDWPFSVLRMSSVLASNGFLPLFRSLSHCSRTRRNESL